VRLPAREVERRQSGIAAHRDEHAMGLAETQDQNCARNCDGAILRKLEYLVDWASWAGSNGDGGV
jgi:hypothetical protein